MKGDGHMHECCRGIGLCLPKECRGLDPDKKCSWAMSLIECHLQGIKCNFQYTPHGPYKYCRCPVHESRV
jgi:hypothetical protein